MQRWGKVIGRIAAHQKTDPFPGKVVDISDVLEGTVALEQFDCSTICQQADAGLFGRDPFQQISDVIQCHIRVFFFFPVHMKKHPCIH